MYFPNLFLLFCVHVYVCVLHYDLGFKTYCLLMCTVFWCVLQFLNCCTAGVFLFVKFILNICNRLLFVIPMYLVARLIGTCTVIGYLVYFPEPHEKETTLPYSFIENFVITIHICVLIVSPLIWDLSSVTVVFTEL